MSGAVDPNTKSKKKHVTLRIFDESTATALLNFFPRTKNDREHLKGTKLSKDILLLDTAAAQYRDSKVNPDITASLSRIIKTLNTGFQCTNTLIDWLDCVRSDQQLDSELRDAFYFADALALRDTIRDDLVVLREALGNQLMHKKQQKAGPKVTKRGTEKKSEGPHRRVGRPIKMNDYLLVDLVQRLLEERNKEMDAGLAKKRKSNLTSGSAKKHKKDLRTGLTSPTVAVLSIIANSINADRKFRDPENLSKLAKRVLERRPSLKLLYLL